MRFYNLLKSVSYKENCNFREIYSDIQRNTSKDILSLLPKDIIEKTEELCDNFSEQKLSELISVVEPFHNKCAEYLPSLDEQNTMFLNKLKESFCDIGYFYKNGAFRKIRGRHLFVIEAKLIAFFVADDFGRVEGVRVAPFVRVADARLYKNKDKNFCVANGISDDDAQISDIKFYDETAFYKTLRHLEHIDFSLEDEIKIEAEQIEKLVKSSLVASSVCENRAIPAYYKKLCKNDFPVLKAISLTLIQSVMFFVLLTLVLGIFSGLGAYIGGYKNFFGMFTVVYFYILTAAISVIYGVIAFKRIRGGRF